MAGAIDHELDTLSKKAFFHSSLTEPHFRSFFLSSVFIFIIWTNLLIIVSVLVHFIVRALRDSIFAAPFSDDRGIRIGEDEEDFLRDYVEIDYDGRSPHTYATEERAERSAKRRSEKS